MDSQWIKPKADAEAPTVVFVHGIMSDGASGWKNKKTGAYWPRLAVDELTDAGVYVFSYHSRAFGGRFRVTDAADALWDELKRHGILQSRIVVLVCHSMGGIVARRPAGAAARRARRARHRHRPVPGGLAVGRSAVRCRAARRAAAPGARDRRQRRSRARAARHLDRVWAWA